MNLTAHVINGRLVLDEPTSLPEGTEVTLTIADLGDELDEAERTARHAALGEAWESAQRGELRPASQLIDELRRAELAYSFGQLPRPNARRPGPIVGGGKIVPPRLSASSTN